jgi:alpha-glucosidase (family GH31 glycosyl hydrolase)
MQPASETFRALFRVETAPKTDSRCIVIRGKLRVSVLTSRLLRLETVRGGAFCDQPTQKVWFRDLDRPRFSVEESGDGMTLRTSDCIFKIDLGKRALTSVTFKSGKTVTDFQSGNLKGTCRTLDGVNGAHSLENGLMSRGGVSVLDDSKSCLIAADGSVLPRADSGSDLYYFAYGSDYRGCLRDFYRLCGPTPLVPRWCLGNWWSRYKAYSQQEYLDLMQRFCDAEIPLTVATIDMDWHWVKVGEKFTKEQLGLSSAQPRRLRDIFSGQGWTGYSWNTDLFPDYRAMLKKLHDMDLKVTVNLHPAQGVRPFEDMYAEMARAMGVDPKTNKTIRFDIANPQFCEAYFNILHKPYEEDGVDFWWIDWQQEKTTSVPGLDPLWALNHYHTLFSARGGKRPLILSRFAQAGSHRYPLGFSGDTVITWKSLDFQPYFTANAANVGYTWWSHDIGGHMLGSRSDELYARWVQFGQYSPIMRLHSTADPFMGKEPWTYGWAAQQAATAALRERHAMIPYLYSMNRRTHAEGRALIEPLYYEYPDAEDAYKAPNEYFFGSELLVRPVTEPTNKTTTLAKARVWLPRGRWTDWYTGAIYEGEQWLDLYRGLGSIPVLAKAGAIVPLASDDRSNDWRNPQALTVRVFRGTNSFTLYEDDGDTTAYRDGAFAETVLSVREAGRDLAFTIQPAKGDLSTLPQKRDWTLVFDDISKAETITVKVNGRIKEIAPTHTDGKTLLKLTGVPVTAKTEIAFSGITARENRDKQLLITEVLSKYQMTTVAKSMLFGGFAKDITKPFPSHDAALYGPVKEIFQMK